MDETVYKIEVLITSLKNNESVDTLDIYRGVWPNEYTYYTDIRGYLEGIYFSICFRHVRRTRKVEHKISFTTDCVKDIREIVEAHGLEITE